MKIEKPKCEQCQIRQVRAKGLCSNCYGKKYRKEHGKTDKAKQYNKEYNKEYRKTDAYKMAIQKYNRSKGKLATKKYVTKKYGTESVIYKKVMGMVESGVTITNACINIGISRSSFTKNISDAQRNELTQIRLANKKTISKRRDLFYLSY